MDQSLELAVALFISFPSLVCREHLLSDAALASRALSIWWNPTFHIPGSWEGLWGAERLEEREAFAELLNLHLTSANSAAACVCFCA